MSSKFKPNTTQTPNVLFDRLMYELPDAEFKVLCAIVRKTYGWHKDSDRIANSQFEAMTGKAKRQIQRAKASLKAKGLIRETLPDRQDGIAEYEFLEPDGVSLASPPHDTGDTQGVTQATHTKDTKQKTLNKSKKPIEDDTALQSYVNKYLKTIQDKTGMVLYGDYKLRAVLKRVIKTEKPEYIEDVLQGYLQDDFMKQKRAWSFSGFFASKEKMERYKSQPKAIQTAPVVLPDDIAAEMDALSKIV